ncbi:HWE histidine kinase domain-containing protein [Mesorhizobium sp. SB112]|uniref:sensor histidine kinase n=1 Tax=Mesorhizobium sp. SB112 TaxID=3151853 RepID=UPI0032636F67
MNAENRRKKSSLPESVLSTVSDAERRLTLHRLGVLDTENDPDFDKLTKLAATIMDTPISLVSLVDLERQWFKSRHGLDDTETPINLSFCAHAISSEDDVTIVPDAATDQRFSDNALVTGEMGIRFYAGAPIIVFGQKIGTLCVIDKRKRDEPSSKELEQLKMLAGLAASLFELKDGARAGVLVREALDKEEKRRAIAVEAAALSSWAWDARTGEIEYDASFAELFNLPSDKPLRVRDMFLAIDRRDWKDAEALFRSTLAGNDHYFSEYRVRGIDPPRWLATRGRVLARSPDGKPTLLMGVNYDITERKSAEERQRLLLREINHRVKNTLATVQALATQTVRHSSKPNEFLEAFSSRLQALGLAHGLLSDHEWRGIRIAELVNKEVQPFDDAKHARIAISGPDVLLSPDQALGVGLILHELASNALKYGSLSVPEGHVKLSWNVHGLHSARRIVINWREEGGPTVSDPTRQGFGSILIRRSLAKVISSEVVHEFHPEGVRAKISMPLEADEPQY